MVKVNQNYLKLSKSYLFSTIAQKVGAYTKEHPDKQVLRLGIGDVTKPLTPTVISALHQAVDEMGQADRFRGYAPDLGYAFLRETIAKNDFAARDCDIEADEIFVSDGAKSDCGNMQEIFDEENTVGICDPVYPVYMDSNVMAGRKIVLMPCTEENGFIPEIPDPMPDIVYLCFPNNPTGTVIGKDKLQKWVDRANESGSVILYDAAYEAYIRTDSVHSIYECRGAKECAIEFHSFSKNAGFTGLRLGYAVVPKALVRENVSLHSLWARRHGTKYNGAPYIVQRAGEAVYSETGRAEIASLVDYYMENATMIRDGLKDAGFKVFGGVDAPYIWLKTPGQMSSWDFFDHLLTTANVVGTPGSGFGANGEGYFRLSAFGSHENTAEAVRRIRENI
ncbi:MAG: LL-diaminopimelate aminotransferase [Lachnospiraceae bacterium]|nr:LL-diaminopimelate aminotransferase [Lachnospiraceae bacterium]